MSVKPDPRAILAALCLIVSACASQQSPAPAADLGPGSPAIGRAYAQEVCAACHAIPPDGADSAHLYAPPFREIANAPGMTETAFRAWMSSSHPTMPDIILEPDRIDDLWAYIASLKDE
ncbi:MAG: hypothetical protein JNM59_10940 [Hyphomonadaceae bacterium]|nr:hypothetical protein [Hyphomonadaceae bacterium]